MIEPFIINYTQNNCDIKQNFESVFRFTTVTDEVYIPRLYHR